MTTIVLVPGLLCSPRLWRAQVDELAQDHHVVVFDHRRDADFTRMARRLLAEVKGRFALVGLSMGGYLAQEVAAQVPGRVERLALICTRSEPDTDEGRQRRMAQVAEAEAEAGGFADVAARLGRSWVAAAHRTADSRAVLAEMAAWAGVEAFRRQQEAIAFRRDMRPLLGSIRCPTLVLCGREDEVTPMAGHLAMAGAIPGADLVVLGGCGHLAPLERPDAVTHALRAWIGR